MLTKDQKRILRSDIFRHLDGIVTAPSAYCLYTHGVLDHILQEKETEISALASAFKANEGYLNVALQTLASQGWIGSNVDNKKDKVYYFVNEQSEEAFSLVPLYEDVVELLKFSGKFHNRLFELEPFLKWEKITHKFLEGYGKVTDSPLTAQILKHIEGVLAGPTIVLMGMSGMFHKYFMEASFKPDEFHKDADSFEKLIDFFVRLGWFEKKNGTYRFTSKGIFFAKRASAYGVTVSYIPSLRNLDELIFGDPGYLRVGPGEKEKHVDRAMNVWGSGGAHSAYFKKVDEILIDIFNRPLEDQPRGVLDMGCGNGAFLEHIFNVIEKRTLRGEHLEDHPLFLVGADYNTTALEITRKNLIKADIWAKVIHGDIGDPDGLAEKLREDYGIALPDLLNVRTFLDHNRVFNHPKNDHGFQSHSEGAFAFQGVRVNNNIVEASLYEHILKWKPYINKHGLLLIELHSLPSELISKNLGITPATAYNATHGYSDQYILELDAFMKVLEKAGLKADPRFLSKFPDNELANISVGMYQY